MLDITGINMIEFPFKDLKLIYDLISFDGEPFLRHYQDYRKKDIISYFVDDDENGSRWLYSSVTNEELTDYLSTNISLRELLSNLKTDLKFFIEFDKEDNISNMTLIQDELDQKYLPEDESFFPLEIPSVYKEQVKKYNFINLFLANGVFMKAESKEKSKNYGLVKATDASNVLGAVGISWDKKVEKEVEDKFISVGITNSKRINKAKTEAAQLYTMDVARLKVASFAVALYPNPIINITENALLNKEWLLKVLKEFKEEVIEIDKKSNEEVATIASKYRDVNDMKAIYEPLIKLYENKNVTVSLTDSHFNNGRILKPIKEEIKSKLIIERSKKSLEQEETYERVIKAKFNEKTNKPIFSSGYTLFDLATTTTWETERIEFEGNLFKLSYPLSLKYSVVNGVTILEHKLLDIYATGEEMPEVINDVSRQFYERYNSLFSSEDESQLTPIALQQKKYLEIITGV